MSAGGCGGCCWQLSARVELCCCHGTLLAAGEDKGQGEAAPDASEQVGHACQSVHSGNLGTFFAPFGRSLEVEMRMLPGDVLA